MTRRRTFQVDVTVGGKLNLDIEAESATIARAIAEYLFDQPGYAAEYDPPSQKPSSVSPSRSSTREDAS